MTRARTLLAALALLASAAAGHAADVVVLCAGAVKPALAELAPTWEARTGHTLRIAYATAGDLRRQLAAGVQADVVIMPQENFGAVEKAGVTRTASRRDLGAVGIGVAVRTGAAVPDVSSEDGLRRALLDARSLTFMDPARGTSGRHLDEVVLPKLAIRDAVRAKAVLGEGGMIGEKVARGEVELAMQQMTELLPVAGITIAGPLPASLQKTTVYSGALMTAATAPAEAAQLIDFLVSAPARSVFLAKGFSAP